ncbi:hypothetical protein HOY34_21445 [Xinfangfangia sp. D13-10-4-6]|uniref:dynamin family protein n=1 Tax=Pseudogemmobacter hezensis TaxID=2737662 RepID=UPI001557D410|nr:dynamin family protein [Pseudogemmobacter hezensis]NPD17745.1 hypothetical protein [Pseudogemmobacter hezensis]
MSTLVPQSRKADGSTAPARVVICGEVSAGKSTVINALLRSYVLPDNIGQTTRPLVIAGWRQKTGIEVDHNDGRQSSAALPGEREVFHDARTVRLWQDQPHLSGIELIELPLTRAEDLTDEQIALVASADVMIWVTIGSQAWRLTEKAIVESFGTARPQSSILVVSRADKLRNDTDRGRMMDRMARETSEFFGARLFLHGDRRRIIGSAGSDMDWQATGGAALAAKLHEMLEPGGAAGGEHAPHAAPVDSMPDAVADLAGAQGFDVSGSDGAIFPEVEVIVSDDMPGPARETNTAPEAEAAPEPAAVALAMAPEAEHPAADDVTAAADGVPGFTRKAPMRHAVAAMPGVLVAGISHQNGAGGYEHCGGDADQVELVGRICDNLSVTLDTAWPADGDTGGLNAFSLSGRSRSLLFQAVPALGLVFMMADAALMNLGMANMALNQLCLELRGASS